MTDLLARLAQRPPAPPPGLTGPYLEYAERKCVEFDLDLALDALAAVLEDYRRLVRARGGIIAEKHHSLDAKDAAFCLSLTCSNGETILRELRGATSGEGAGHGG